MLAGSGGMKRARQRDEHKDIMNYFGVIDDGSNSSEA
jgi:hypothetical protein